MNVKNKFIYILAFLVISVLGMIVFDIFYLSPPNYLTLEDVKPVFQENKGVFTEVADSLSQQAVIDSICRVGSGRFEVNGEAISNLAIEYRSFLEAYPQISCIETESSGLLPSEKSNVYLTPPAVKFVVSYQMRPIEGLLYVKNLKEGEKLNPEYIGEYSMVESASADKWFYFKAK